MPAPRPIPSHVPLDSPAHIPERQQLDPEPTRPLGSPPSPTSPASRTFSLGPELDRLNCWGRAEGFGTDLRRYLEQRLVTLLARDLHAGLNSDELRIFLAVFGRTLAVGKYVEKIAKDDFIEGVRDETGLIRTDRDGIPWMRPAVSGFAAYKAGIEGLQVKNLLTVFRFEWRGREQRAYSPFGCQMYACAAGYAAGKFSKTEAESQEAFRQAQIHAKPAFAIAMGDLTLADRDEVEHPFFDGNRLFLGISGEVVPDPPAHARKGSRARDERHRLPATRRGPIH